MTNTEDGPRLVSPRRVLERVAAAIPQDCHDDIVIIGSLAAGFHFFGDNPGLLVRTKDVDCLLSPRIRALPAGAAVTARLRDEGWTYRREERFSEPGDDATPDADLPAVRLCPPDEQGWFIELLTVPESETDLERRFTRLVTSEGHFGLPSLGFLSLTVVEPSSTEFGLRVARPEMMALANLLHHPTIGAETMGGRIGSRDIKRSNKDLGRALALAWLGEARDEDVLDK